MSDNDRMKILLSILFILISTYSIAESKKMSEHGMFSGRVSYLREEANLVRIKVDFENVKYLNKKDRVEFWDQHNPAFHCRAYVAGKSSNYLLIKVPNMNDCSSRVSLGAGVYLKFFSEDLENNIAMGKELIEILVKKKMALTSKILSRKKQLDSHIEKVNAVSSRYQVLRDKLEAQWRDELASLEEDRLDALRNYKGLEVRINEIEFKLQKYRISDENLSLDRWSLDPRLFYKK